MIFICVGFLSIVQEVSNPVNVNVLFIRPWILKLYISTVLLVGKSLGTTDLKKKTIIYSGKITKQKINAVHELFIYYILYQSIISAGNVPLSPLMLINHWWCSYGFINLLLHIIRLMSDSGLITNLVLSRLYIVFFIFLFYASVCVR